MQFDANKIISINPYMHLNLYVPSFHVTATNYAFYLQPSFFLNLASVKDSTFASVFHTKPK